MIIIIAAILTSLIICYLVSRYYERYLSQHRAAWLKQRQIILFQLQRIEELETEREILHGVAVKALSTPAAEDYLEVSGLGLTVWRN